MNLNLSERVVIVTGGCRGIGAAIVLALSTEGAIPVIAGHSTSSDGERLATEIRNKGGAQTLLVDVDLCDPSNCRMVVNEIIKQYNRIDGLVNNAGINDGVSLETGSPEKYLESLKKNLLHYYSMAHFALPYLIKSKGSIVNIGSKVAVTGQGNTSGYASAKGGINALTREWAVEMLKYEIRVNCVIPSEVWTPMYETWIGTAPEQQEKLRSITSKIPLGNRMTTPEEIANMVVFLLSERSSHTTGQLFYVDGGYVHLDRCIS